jgi:catabolite regulation protein CreA
MVSPGTILCLSFVKKTDFLLHKTHVVFNKGISLLGRLMDTVELYQRKNNKFNPLVLTKLVANFRSHPAILKVPNELFYESDLVVIYLISTFLSAVY